MILTVSDDPEFQICHEVIVDNDATLSTFLNECVNNMKDYRNISLTDLLVVINGKKIIPGNKNLNEKLLNLGFSNADLVLVQKKPSHLVPSTSKQNDRTNIIADLVKAIKVPSHSKLNPNQVIARKHNLLESDIAALRREYQLLMDNADSGHMRNLSDSMKEIIRKNDFESYVAKVVRDQQKMNDPTDTEGQRLIEEQIRLKNIIMARNYAIEHMPEAYIPVNMLYISIKINGVLTQAFIDTGAQLSILSDSEALRCGLLDVMDKAYNVTVHGVAGKMECIGKIHACVVQIGDNCYHCNFEVLSGQATPVLIGLDFLRRHLCVIDLKNDCLSFGDSSKTKFLSDAEINISHHHHQ